MRFLENSFKFLGKNIIFVIPLFLVNLFYTFTFFLKTNISELEGILQEISARGNQYINNNPQITEEIMKQIIPDPDGLRNVMGISFILFLLIIPATYGIINRIYSEGKASFGSFFVEMKNNVLKFILYCFSLMFLFIGVGLAVFIVTLIVGIIGQTSVAAMTLIIILMALLGIIFSIFLTNVTIMGFAVVVTDKTGAFSAISRGISAIRAYFWPTIGITLLLGFGTSVVNSTIMAILMKNLKEVVAISSATVSTIFMFILIVFNFEIYRYQTDQDVQTIDQIPNASDI